MKDIKNTDTFDDVIASGDDDALIDFIVKDAEDEAKEKKEEEE